MKVLEGRVEGWTAQSGATALTLGVFDGVHLGHRSLLSQAFDHRGTKAVITFEPHPVEVLAPGTEPRLITTLDERLDLLAGAGAELVAVLDLAEVRMYSPEEFVDRVLVEKLDVGALTIGSDFHFGRDRAGDVEFLRGAGQKRGFDVAVADLVAEGGQTVSSTRIRSLIEGGFVAEASALLGSMYRMTNEVLQGDKRGRDLGYPTANLAPVPRKVTPADGVYATLATVGGTTHMAATSVGVRPTFGGGERLVEAHILDFDEDIYGDDLTISFVEHLRPELDFDSVDELIDLMADDVARSREILAPVMG